MVVIYRNHIAQQGAIGYNIWYGGVAHRLEQAAHNHLVVGSIPTAPTKHKHNKQEA